MPRPHISFSELNSFASGCQHRWKLDYLEGRRSEKFSVNFDFGTAVHGVLERHLTRLIPIDTAAAVSLFHETFDKLLAQHRSRYDRPVSDKDLIELRAAGKRIVCCIKVAPELRDIEVVHNEFGLFEPIARDDGIDIKFKGFIDIIFKGKDKRKKTLLWVCDFKTCSWGWDRETRGDKWKHFQLLLYKHFLCKKFDIDPRQVRTAFVLLKKRPPKETDVVEFFPISAGPISVQRALDALGSNLTEMFACEAAGSFPKDRSQCKDRYGSQCPYLGTPLCPEDPK